GKANYELVRFSESAEHYRKAIEIAERFGGPKSLSLGRILFGLGRTLTADGKPDDALVPLQRAVALSESQLPHSKYELLEILGEVGHAELARGKPLAAIPIFERIVKEDPKGEIQSHAMTEFLLARALDETGRDPKRARKLAASALAAFPNTGKGPRFERD